MATAVRAYKESFGFDAPPFTYADFEESDVIVLAGSNLCIAHPILWQRVLANRRSPEIVVIDPRRTETAAQATRHLAIRPKSDLVLYYGLARLLIERGQLDRDYVAAHTEGFAGFEEHVRAFTLQRTAAATGLSEAEILGFTDLIGSGKRVSFWWTMGINQGWEATRTAQAIINLALMTGNLGKPGTGAKLDFLVVQDIYHSTETAQLAHLVLPAAGWGEKEGTLINSERRIGLVKRVARAPGEALSDFRIFRLLAAAWGCGGMFERWKTPEEVFAILQELSEGTPCDIGGIAGYDQLDREGGVQWPFPKTAADPPAQERRLFEDGRFFTKSGKARFVWDEPALAPEPTDADYPLVLLTGRGSSAQWHTQTRTGKSTVLLKLAPRENLVEIHPDDAGSRGIRSGDAVEVSSRRGAIAIRALVTPTVPRGSVFIPMHEESTNRLTLPVFDPHSRQPSYKHCAVKVSRQR